MILISSNHRQNQDTISEMIHYPSLHNRAWRYDLRFVTTFKRKNEHIISLLCQLHMQKCDTRIQRVLYIILILKYVHLLIYMLSRNNGVNMKEGAGIILLIILRRKSHISLTWQTCLCCKSIIVPQH